MRWVGAVAASCLLLVACQGDAEQAGPLWGDRPVEPLDLRGELSAKEVPLLAELSLRLDLYVADGTEVEFEPAVPPDFTGTVEARPARPFGAGEWRRFDLVLKPVALGDLTIPSFRVQAGEDGAVATSPEWTVTVGSLLAGAGDEIEAPGQPFEPRFVWWPWLVGAAGALALLGIAVWWWRRKPAEQQVSATPLPSHVKALRALARLRQAPRATPAQVEAFYVEVSQILRIYLEGRFGLHAPERTTEEFLVEMESDPRLSVEHRQNLGQFLAQCDLVKFAGAIPTEQVHDTTFEVAEKFIEATREDRVLEGAA